MRDLRSYSFFFCSLSAVLQWRASAIRVVGRSSAVKRQQPPDGPVQWPKAAIVVEKYDLSLKVIPPEHTHTHTVILLHGLDRTSDDFVGLPGLMAELQVPHGGTKFIFPEAPRRTMCWPQGPQYGVPAWYTYFSDLDTYSEPNKDDVIDTDALHKMRLKIQRIIDDEVTELSDPKRIIIGGFSQGGCVAAHSALTYTKSLGGAILLRSNLMQRTANILGRPNMTKLPVFAFRAELDDTYATSLTDMRFDMLRNAGMSVTVHDEPGLTHEDESLSELYYVGKWIGKVFFDLDVDVTHKVNPDADSGSSLIQSRSSELPELSPKKYCEEGAMCCGHCCVGSNADVVFNETSGTGYLGTYHAHIAGFEEGGSVGVRIKGDIQAKAELKKWVIKRSLTPSGRHKVECDFSESIQLKDADGTEESVGGMMERSEYASRVQVDGRQCPAYSMWSQLRYLHTSGICCSDPANSSRLLWVPDELVSTTSVGSKRLRWAWPCGRLLNQDGELCVGPGENSDLLEVQLAHKKQKQHVWKCLSYDDLASEALIAAEQVTQRCERDSSNGKSEEDLRKTRKQVLINEEIANNREKDAE